MRTEPAELEPPPLEPPPQERLPWQRASFLGPIAVVLVVLGLVRLPYFVLSPGPAREVEPLIHVNGHAVYPSQGHLLLTAVYETAQQVNAYQALRGWLDPSEAVIPERYVLAPGQTPQQAQVLQLSIMDTSKIDAAVVALTGFADYPAKHGSGVLVESTIPGSPADGKLFAGDVLKAADGQPLPDVAALTPKVTAARGRTIDLTVDRAGKTLHLSLAPTTVKGIDHPVIGIGAVDTFPFPLTIESGDIGGPSAGLMWTLGLIDLLTSGDLTGGKTIAGTGTIAVDDGSVGPIGGIQQKVIAAERAGAITFFAPADNFAEACQVAHGIRVVEVHNYADALAYLASTGIDVPAPHAPAAATDEGFKVPEPVNRRPRTCLG